MMQQGQGLYEDLRAILSKYVIYLYLTLLLRTISKLDPKFQL